MSAFEGKDYIVVVQCHIVMERCSGFFCERAFTQRTGGFETLPKDASPRIVYLTCGGCCGRALQRKLVNIATKASAKDGVGKEKFLVKFASCVTTDNHHGPPCPHIDYLKTLVARLGLDVSMDTHISAKSKRLREEGVYKSGCD